MNLKDRLAAHLDELRYHRFGSYATPTDVIRVLEIVEELVTCIEGNQVNAVAITEANSNQKQ